MLIGSVGWRHAHWQDSFYPETLPDDWWLTYYSNEFGCVLASAEQLGHDTAAAWLDDTHERFRFFLQLGPAADWAAVPAVAQLLGERLGGVVSGAHVPASGQTPVQRLCERGVQLAVDAGPEHPWLQAGIARPLWRPGSRATGCPIGLIPDADRGDRRTLRQHVERFGQQAGQGGVAEPALFLGGAQLRPEALRDAAVIAGLLGF